MMALARQNVNLAAAAVALLVWGCDAFATFPRGGPSPVVPPAATSAPDRYADVVAAPLPLPQNATPPPPHVEAPAAPNTNPPPPIRKQGDLTVHSPPHTKEIRGLRLRTNVAGALSAGSPRTWAGIEVPSYVELTIAQTELFLLDSAGPEGHFAFYREPYRYGVCPVTGARNCVFGAVLYDREGKVTWKVALTKLLSRSDHLEIQDIRYQAGVLYFNEACQSYAREADGRCSSLVAYSPTEKRVLWRTPPLISNGVFALAGAYLVTGYGFTSEADWLSIVRAADGKIMRRIPLPAATNDIDAQSDGTLRVAYYGDKVLFFRMAGFDGEAPRLVLFPHAPAPAPAGEAPRGDPLF